MGKKFDVFYFSSTHWDREWYQDFQGFRYRLVKMVDKLMELFEKDGDYKTFHFWEEALWRDSLHISGGKPPTEANV